MADRCDSILNETVEGHTMERASQQPTTPQPQPTLTELTLWVHTQQQELSALQDAVRLARRRRRSWTDLTVRLALALALALVTFGFGARSFDHAAAAPVTSNFNPLQLALLRWYETNQSGERIRLPVVDPRAAAFDGVHLWVTDAYNNTVKKVRVSDGAVIGTYPVGAGPTAVAFDGSSIWVANTTGNTVQKLNASDGSADPVVAPIALNRPSSLAFDGTAMWVGDATELAKVRVTDGAILLRYQTPAPSTGLALGPRTPAGESIWVTMAQYDEVRELLTDGSLLAKFRSTCQAGTITGCSSAISRPTAIATDGQDVWVTNSGSATVVRISSSGTGIISSIPVGTNPSGIAFDGANMWVTNSGSNSVTKLPIGGGTVGTYSTSGPPKAIAFDGANMLVVTPGDAITGGNLAKY
jgi:YVTN family beta-propeller protein